MKHTPERSLEVKGDFVFATQDLIQSALRNLILVTDGLLGGFYLIWYVVATAHRPLKQPEYFLIAALLALTGGLAWRLIPKRLLAAQVVWQAGLAVAVTLALYISQRPEMVFLYALLPLIAFVTIDWWAGATVEALVIGLLIGVAYSPVMPSIPFSYSLATVLGGAYTGLLGWVVISALLTVTQWSLFYADRAQKSLQEAYEQRVELKQVQDDLLQANRELARLSERLEVMYRVAEEARRAKEEFVANVSHELRTPLNMILGFSEVITQSPHIYGARLPPTLLADIATIQRNSQHLAKLVDDVLDLSQIEAGRMALTREWVSPLTIIEEAIEAVRPLFEFKGLDLEKEISPDLPTLFCDSTRVRQVVINLLSNAGRFTDRGRVRLKMWQAEDNILCSVSDTGPGIPHEAQKRLFEPFQQADSSIHREHGGSGLGLSISKRFVEMHGGKMWLESEMGVGTTITFSLPLKMPSSAAPGEGGDARRWFSPHSALDYRLRTRRSRAPTPAITPRFVLIEGGGTLRRTFARYADNVECISVHDLPAATHELTRAPAQALIANVPHEERSPEFMARLARLPHHTPAILCWAPGENEAIRRLGVARYLVKPITREMLLAALEELGGGVRHVLLVDDEPEILRLFTRMLSSAGRGYEVLQAKNGRHALNLLRERRPDVMLLDLVMEGMNGFQVLEEKSRDSAIRDIPVVVISSRDPAGEPIMSDTLTVLRGGGISARDLLDCAQAISEILSLSAPPAAPTQPEMSVV